MLKKSVHLLYIIYININYFIILFIIFLISSYANR